MFTKSANEIINTLKANKRITAEQAQQVRDEINAALPLTAAAGQAQRQAIANAIDLLANRT